MGVPARVVSALTRMNPLLTVQPVRGLVDEKIQITALNLLPHQKTTLHSLHQSETGDFWEAYGHYVSDHHGIVTVSKDQSLGGTYVGTEPMGLLWSMRPVPGSRTGLRLRKQDVLSPMVVKISVYNGHQSQDFRQTSPLTSSVTERWYMAPGVQRVDVREKGVRGTLFFPPGPGPFAGVLDLWGGGGGLVEYRSALLASHGFVSMALDYINPEGIQIKDNLSYFEKSYQILQNHPKVQKERLAMFGLCLGSIISLNLMVNSSIIKPQCCVCISGTHLMPLDKSPFSLSKIIKSREKMVRVNEENQVIIKDLVLPVPTDPAYKVDVGRIKCPLLLVNGDDDQNCASVESAEDIEMMMEQAGNRHLLEILTYPGAGHLIEPPYTPHIRASNFFLQEKEKIVMLWGGRTKPHADAQEDAWKKILAFLQQHLYFNSSSTLQARL